MPETSRKKGMQLSGLMSEVIINVISLDMMPMMKQGPGAYSLVHNYYLDSIVCMYVISPKSISGTFVFRI